MTDTQLHSFYSLSAFRYSNNPRPPSRNCINNCPEAIRGFSYDGPPPTPISSTCRPIPPFLGRYLSPHVDSSLYLTAGPLRPHLTLAAPPLPTAHISSPSLPVKAILITVKFIITLTNGLPSAVKTSTPCPAAVTM